MDALDGNTINIKSWDGNIAVQGSDKDLVVQFYPGTRINQVKSQAQGCPVFDPVDMIKVYHPGEPLNVPERPVIEMDKHRFRHQWDLYKQGKDQKVEGTPLSVLFPGKPEIVKTLEVSHITTVQQLAAISDTATQNMMFGLNLRQEAQKYLDQANSSVTFHKYEKEKEELQFQIRELSEQVALLKAQASEKKIEPAPVAADQSASIAALTQLVTNMQAQMQQPKRVGWPKGKPRKPKTEETSSAA